MEEIESLDCKIISDFAAMHNLLVSIDTREIKPIISGSNGQVFVYSDVPALLAVAWSPDNLSSDQWTGTIRKMLRLGFSIVRDCASLSAADAKQAAFAVALAGITPTANAAAINAKVCDVIRAARLRKRRQIEHQRVFKELRLLRAGTDLSDFDADFIPNEYHLHL